MKRYDSYTDTGIAWIGEIPSHWEVTKGKFATSVLAGFAFDSDKFTPDEGYMPLIRIRDIFSNTTEMNYSGGVPLEYIIKKGDVLVGMDGDFNVARWEGNDALLNQRVCTIKETKKMLSRFAFYILPRPLQLINDICYATTVKHLSTGDIYNTILPIPPLEEQEAIADYLDRKCASIDGIIATQERRIALLNELKQSVITEAVTRGINPNAPLRDSGIDGVGQIPEHWEVMRFKNIMSLKTTPSISENKIGLENIESGSGKFIEMDNEFDGNGVEFVEGDILYGKLRPYLKKVWLAEFGGNAVGDFFVFHHTKKSDNRYLKYLMLSEPFTSQANGATNGAKMPRVSSNFILTLKVAVPSIEEQTEIVNFIETKISPLDSALAKAKREIELLREYKQSVITEAVTGKIKVC